MKYVFVKGFNPAYHRFLMVYFKEHGIDIDEKTTLREVEGRLSHLDRDNMSEVERLLTYYARDWRSHPECRPSPYYLLDRALGGKGRPDFDKMRQLESNLSPSRGKLLFTREEVAADISGFYRKYMRTPLKSDLEKGATDERLAAYLSMNELRPAAVEHPQHNESRERDVRQMAGGLLSWLQGITLGSMVGDIDRILGEHESKPEHMREITDTCTGRPEKRVCEHESEYLKLQVYQHLEEGAVTTLLFPSRGFLISDTVLEEGWNDVVFPRYYVLQERHTESDIQSNKRECYCKGQSEAEIDSIDQNKGSPAWIRTRVTGCRRDAFAPKAYMLGRYTTGLHVLPGIFQF